MTNVCSLTKVMHGVCSVGGGNVLVNKHRRALAYGARARDNKWKWS